MYINYIYIYIYIYIKYAITHRHIGITVQFVADLKTTVTMTLEITNSALQYIIFDHQTK